MWVFVIVNIDEYDKLLCSFFLQLIPPPHTRTYELFFFCFVFFVFIFFVLFFSIFYVEKICVNDQVKTDFN